jgi:hypothetical protein
MLQQLRLFRLLISAQDIVLQLGGLVNDEHGKMVMDGIPVSVQENLLCK